MPTLPDAPTLLHGSVFVLELVKDFETKAPAGAKVSVIGASGGAAVVKLNQEQLQKLAPVVGDVVVWFVKDTPWAMEGGRSGKSTTFVRVADAGDLDAIASALSTVDARK